MTANRSLSLSDGLRSDVGERSQPSAFPFHEYEYSHPAKSSSCSAGGDTVAKRCRQIVEYYEDESSKPVYETARWLVEQLSPEEKETAARCSYSYWYLSTQQQQQQNQQPLSESIRSATALREAIRHMDCAEDPTEILRLFKATLKFHRNHDTWLYRTCMTKSVEDDTATKSLELRDRIHDELANYQTNVVRGYDKEDRAIFFAFPRKSAGTVEGEQAFVDSLLYTIERTLACSEFRSVGRQDQLFVVLDTKAGSCPPVKTLQNAIGILQRHYPGRLKGCVIINAPYVMRTLWKMLKPFLHPVTYQKYIFGPSVNNQKNNAAVIADLIDESQAMPVLMPGRGKLKAPVSVDRFLYEVPFHGLYDEHCGSAGTANNYGGDDKATLLSPSDNNPLQKRHPSPSTESNSTRSLSSTDSSTVVYQQQHQQSSGQETTKSRSRRPSLRRFGLSSSRRRNNNKQQESRNIPTPGVSVRTLAIGTLSVEYLPAPPLSPPEADNDR